MDIDVIKTMKGNLPVTKLETPMWFHPKDDISEGLEYLIDWYFFDKQGNLFAHVIYDGEEQKETDCLTADWNANNSIDLYPTREDAIPEKTKKELQVLNITKGCDVYLLNSIITQYNVEHPDKQIELIPEKEYCDYFKVLRNFDALINIIKLFKTT